MSLSSESEQLSVDGTTGLWAAFAKASGEREFYQHWLALQSHLIGGVQCSLAVINRKNQNLEPVAAWPADRDDFGQLSDVIEHTLDERCGQLEELTQGRFAIAYPVVFDDAVHTIVSFEVHVHSDRELQVAMERLQWGIGWLELLWRRKEVENNKDIVARLKTSVDLLAVTLNQEEFAAAATVFTTELAMAAGCERVSLGMIENSRCKLHGVSFSADVEHKMNLTKSLEEAMDEAVLQRREIIYPADQDELLINRAHDSLSRQQAMASIATFPLYFNEVYYGAVVCERAADEPFGEKEIEFYRAVMSLAGPALVGKYKNDRPLLRKIYDAAGNELGQLFGSKYLKAKIGAVLALTLVLFMSFTKGDYRLAADTVLEGAVRRAIVTPFDGYIGEAMVRAGDQVRAGDTLCRLDDRDLRLMSLAKQSEFGQLQRQYQEAVAKYDRAQAAIINAQMQQAQAEIDLVAAKLERTRLTAPISGLLVSGDLSQRLGGSVRQGEVLFEITPIGAYRVILKVDERRVGDVSKGQKGVLVLSSQPESKYTFTVTKITPISTSEEGRNYFRVEAALDAKIDSLRPGMEGVGKIFIDRRRLSSIWTRDLVEWCKVKLWRWFA